MRKRREYSSRSLRPASEHRRILHGSARPMLAGSDSIEVAADVAQWRPVEGHAASVRFELDHRVIRDRDPILDQYRRPSSDRSSTGANRAKSPRAISTIAWLVSPSLSFGFTTVSKASTLKALLKCATSQNCQRVI